MEWFRWYHGTVADPKFSVIAKRSQQPRHVVIACWPAILEHASTRSDRGSLEDIDCEEIAVVLDLETSQVEAVYQAMVDKGMIVDDRLVNWEKRQPKREDVTGAERKERWKAKKKEGAERTGTQENAEQRTERARAEQNREEKNREESSSPVETAAGGSLAVPEKAMMTLDDFRSGFLTASGKHLPGGCNAQAVQLCQRFPRDALESAFTRMCEYKGRTIGYLVEILEGKKPARASPGGGLSAEEIRDRNARAAADFLGVDDG